MAKKRGSTRDTRGRRVENLSTDFNPDDVGEYVVASRIPELFGPISRLTILNEIERGPYEPIRAEAANNRTVIVLSKADVIKMYDRLWYWSEPQEGEETEVVNESEKETKGEV